MRFFLPVTTILLSALAVPAIGAEADDSQPAAAKAGETPKAAKENKKAKEEKRICRRISVGTGSRRKEKVCLTTKEWREHNNAR